ARTSGHLRAQILYYIAENLSVRQKEFAARIDAQAGTGRRGSAREVQTAISRLFTYAAWADKYDGAVHNVPIRGVALAMHEPIGVIGIACPEEHPLLGFVSLVAPAIGSGNAVVVIPSEAHPLSATDFYGVLETSDVPGGVVNIATGSTTALVKVLAEHDDVEAVWYFGARDGARMVEQASAANMKRTWCSWHERDWLHEPQGEGREFLRAATQVKNIWVPYGE
ncbi:MAG: aldehyde dehydrogenase family protein, partial [Gemmatimonadaceae bacterium]